MPLRSLFFAQAMSIYLKTNLAAIQCVAISPPISEVIDCDYADDTALHMNGSLPNLNTRTHYIKGVLFFVQAMCI